MRWGVAVVVGSLALGLGGCGESPSGSGPSLSPGETARAYVEALNTKDGARFCSVLAPYLAEFYRDYAEQLFAGERAQRVKRRLGLEGCPLMIRVQIGYMDDGGDQWQRADILRLRVHNRGEVATVKMRLRHHYRGYPDGGARDSRVEEEGLYLVRLAGRWKVAKLSAVADKASLMPDEDAAPDVPDDIAASLKAAGID
jgi:hypothetical protein